MAGTQYGILGIYGCGAVDRNTHEYSILGNKIQKKKVTVEVIDNTEALPYNRSKKIDKGG